MSPDDVSPNEMKHFENISDADFEALRAGSIPGDDERLGEIARFADDLNRAFPASSIDVLEGAHVSAMLAASRLMAANGEPAGESQSSFKPRKQSVFNTFMHSRMAKISASIAAAMLAFAGVAAAGVLPAPLQNTVANVVAPTGIDLPGGSDVKATEPAETLETPEAAHTDASVDESATIENDQGENDDNQGENDDNQGEDASDEASSSAEHAAEAAAEAAQEAADHAAEAAKEAADHAAEKASENAPEDAASSSSGD